MLEARGDWGRLHVSAHGMSEFCSCSQGRLERGDMAFTEPSEEEDEAVKALNYQSQDKGFNGGAGRVRMQSGD